MSDKKIRLLIVDDSALVRQMLSSIFARTTDIEVVGVAHDAYVARDKIKQLNPDVLTLDVAMPRMDGVTFLGNLMRLRPMPVVMVSSLTAQGAEITLRALEFGAVDYVAKPKVYGAGGLQECADELLDKVRAAAQARVRPLERNTRRQVSNDIPERLGADAVHTPRRAMVRFRATDRVIGIGASTGGTEAIKDVLARLPPDMPGIVITQHIPVAFSAAFAKRVDSVSPLTVVQAVDGQQVLPGRAYLAPGDRHLMIVRDGARYVCRLNDGPPVNRHKPSVDVMMRSLARNAGPNAIGLMLTGMGADGVEGLGEMRAAGATVVAQDEKTSVVWGMPGEVVKRGFAHEVLSLGRIPERLVELVEA